MYGGLPITFTEEQELASRLRSVTSDHSIEHNTPGPVVRLMEVNGIGNRGYKFEVEWNRLLEVHD